MKLLIFSALLMVLVGQAPAQAQVDSAQWLFPTNGFGINCYLGGIYTSDLDEKPNTYEHTVDTDIAPLPEWLTGGLYCTRSDLQRVDSNEWQFAVPQEFTPQPLALDLFLDTVNYRIDTLIFNYSSYYEEDLSFELKNLYYSDSTIGFRDNDINRHLISASYWEHVVNGYEYQTTAYCCTFEFGLFGQTLIEAFGAPHQVNFGTVSLDSSRDTTIKISNYSDSAISIWSYALNNPDSGFTLVDTNVHIIPAGSSKSITIRFAPSKVKSYSGSITITTDEEVLNSYTTSLVGSAASSSVIPESPALARLDMFPNPTIDATTISFSLQSDSYVKIEVLDVLGNKISSGFEGTLGAGNHAVPVSLNGLVSGIYYVRILPSGEQVQTLKLVKE